MLETPVTNIRKSANYCTKTRRYAANTMLHLTTTDCIYVLQLLDNSLEAWLLKFHTEDHHQLRPVKTDVWMFTVKLASNINMPPESL